MKTHSPVLKAKVESKDVNTCKWIEVHFDSHEDLRQFADSLRDLADSTVYDHIHLQDHAVSKENPAAIEIIFTKSKHPVKVGAVGPEWSIS